MPRGTTNFEDTDVEQIDFVTEVEDWLKKRKLTARLKFSPGKSSLSFERQMRKAMADFDLQAKRWEGA